MVQWIGELTTPSCLREISSAVEHLVYTEIVIGSIPISPIMKDKELKKDLDELKEMMKYVICQMQNLQSRIDLIQQDPMLWVSEYDDCKRWSSVSQRLK